MTCGVKLAMELRGAGPTGNSAGTPKEVYNLAEAALLTYVTRRWGH